MYFFCSVDRDMETFSQSADSAYVVGMVVGDQYAGNVMKVQAHLAQIVAYGACRNPCVDKYSLPTGSQVVTVAATTGSEAPENEFRHVDGTMVCYVFLLLPKHSIYKGTAKLLNLQAQGLDFLCAVVANQQIGTFFYCIFCCLIVYT